jgi:integrase
MPQRGKGARLWLQPASGGEPATWVIRDGKLKRRIGCRKDETSKAERALARYIEEKYESPRTRRDPSEIKIAEVIALYVDDVVSQHARPKETAARLGRILDFFDQGTLAGLTKGACKKYAEKRDKIAAARRELSDLNAAVRHHWAENRCTVLTPVILPGRRGIPRSRWLTRKEAAALLRACWRYREIQKGHEAGRRSLRHVARFILVGLYTGTRAGAICGAAMLPALGRGWVDLEAGVFYRRAQDAKVNNKRQPTVRIPPRLLAHMRRWHHKGISTKAIIEWNGAPVKRINKAFRSACSVAGLGKDVVPHTLRHTCATWLAQAGVPVHQICGVLGMTEEMFQDVYGHHHPDYQSQAVNALSRR